MIRLVRFAYTPMGTFGRLYAPEFSCFTVERPWVGNEPYVSCIPTGQYALISTRYYRGGYETYEVARVSGRSAIKIHRGNTEDDLQGCIAPGMALGTVRGKWAVTNSAGAFSDFMSAMELVERAERFIVIQNYQGGECERH